MVNRVYIKRTSTNSSPPANNSLSPGELAVEMGTPYRLWCGVPTSIDSTGRKLLVDTSAASVTAFNTRTGAVTLSSSDVTTALTYTPVNKTGDTMTGLLTLSGAPTASLHATTKTYVDTTVSSAVGGVIPSQTSNAGKYLSTNGSALFWSDVDAYPSQTGNSGKFLTTNGTSVSWGSVDALPSQTGNTGKALFTDGTASYWGAVANGAVNGIFWENDQIVAANYTISAGKNAGTFGPITINSGVTVTVPSGSTWSIV